MRHSAVRALGRIGISAVPALAGALAHKDDTIGRTAASQLARLGATTLLIEALEDTHASVRRHAVAGLGQTQDPEVVEPLIRALVDAEWIVRREVADALGSIPDPRVVLPLTSALRDSDQRVREQSAVALGRTGDVRALAPLIAALKDTDRHVRGAAVKGLSHLGSPQAVSSLAQALADSHPTVRTEAASALGELGSPGITALSEALRLGPQAGGTTVAGVLANAGPEGRDALLTALQSQDANARFNAAEILTLVQDDRVTTALVEAADRSDLDIVAAAYRFYIAQGDTSNVPMLVEALHQHGTASMANAYLATGSPSLRAAAALWGARRGYELKKVPAGGEPTWGKAMDSAL